MQIEGLFSSVVSYAAVAIGMALCLFLFVSLKRDIRLCETRSLKKLAAMEADWNTRMEELDEHWKELSQISKLLVPPAPPRSGLNFSKRSQALQMFRHGETPADVSAALSIPRGEAELLVRVYQAEQYPQQQQPASAATSRVTNPDVPAAPPSAWAIPMTSPRLSR